MSTYQQAERFLTATTPLGQDTLLLIGVTGTESISQLFHFQLEFIALNETQVAFDGILGKNVTAHIKAPGGECRHISGICSRISQGGQDSHFTIYRAEIVPEFWFLTRKAQSRIFQAKSVPQILQTVFQGMKVSYQLQGQYEPRDYCVQYRETDFDFASRLMEEEGIFYFFKHESGGHSAVVADNPQSHLNVPFGNSATYAPLADTSVDEDRIVEWEKVQDLRSMKFTLWDHCFELPHKHLEAQKQLSDSAQVGQVSHTLKVGNPDRLEIYDWPGQYAQRFDGVGPGREDRSSDLQKIFKDNQRTTQIRMQQELALCLSTSGASRLRQLTAGHRFSLTEHFNANGDYVLTKVHHVARMSGDYRSGQPDDFAYSNTFSCLPVSVPFRPQRVTPKPVVHGTQTAVVVGPKGEEVYTDKYGRVKVQFHWDREGKNDEKSSCWIRVAQPIAGKRWGGSFWPRVGQEVVVDHLEGDPDQPIIIGSVYNADQMPPYLGKGPDGHYPDQNLVSGIKSNSSKGGIGFNEMRFVDVKDKEQIFLHAERNMDVRVKKDHLEHVEGNQHHVVGTQPNSSDSGQLRERVFQDHHIHVHRDHVEHVEGNVLMLIGNGGAANGGSQDIVLQQTKREKIGGDSHQTIMGSRHTSIGGIETAEAGQEIHLKAGMKVIIEAGVQLTIKGAGGFIDIGPAGVTIEGVMVKINCGGSPGQGTPANPQTPNQAKPNDPEKADDARTGQKSTN